MSDYFLLHPESQTSTGNFLSLSTLVSVEQSLLFPQDSSMCFTEFGSEKTPDLWLEMEKGSL